jgi:flagellar motor switch protein FliM
VFLRRHQGSDVEKILSKDEIADLLSAVRRGQVDIETAAAASAQPAAARSVESCNLFRSCGAEGWRLRNFDLILDSFSRTYAMSLSTRFQRAAHIKLEALESMPFDTLLQRLSGRGAIGVLQLEPLTGGGLLIFDEQLAFSLVEMILGGNSVGQALIPERPLSAIELNVLRDVIVSACPELNKGFGQIEAIKAELVEVVSNLRLLNFVDPEVGVSVSHFKVAIDNLEGHITLVIPHSTLEPLQKKQKLKAVPANSLQNTRWQQLVCDELNNMEVEVQVRLASLSLRVRDILNFQVGDVIDLGIKPEAPVKVSIEERSKFLAIVGVQGNKKAVRISGRIPGGGEK